MVRGALQGAPLDSTKMMDISLGKRSDEATNVAISCCLELCGTLGESTGQGYEGTEMCRVQFYEIPQWSTRVSAMRGEVAASTWQLETFLNVLFCINSSLGCPMVTPTITFSILTTPFVIFLLRYLHRTSQMQFNSHYS